MSQRKPRKKQRDKIDTKLTQKTAEKITTKSRQKHDKIKTINKNQTTKKHPIQANSRQVWGISVYCVMCSGNISLAAAIYAISASVTITPSLYKFSGAISISPLFQTVTP